jgi:glycerophosphoryl diester phosphodiesterase
MPHPFLDGPLPIAIGHRGCAGEVPENTLASFERGLADGAFILESDVHLTADGVPVLIHDEVVDRCTEGSGAVLDHDLAALQALDAGHHFSRPGESGFPFRGRGLRIPTLEEALTAFPGARFNLELKEDVPGMVEQTARVTREAGREADVLLTAAEDPLMARVRRYVAEQQLEVAVGACTGDVVAFAQSALEGGSPPEGPMALQIPARFAGRPLVTRALVDHAHAHGVQIHVWTINDPDEMTDLLDLGVDGLVTDFPARAAELIRRRG